MANNRIKGITIEIGGDTTKLDKALKGTDSQLNKTKASLKDVERLLKFDPGNTELLEQKQRLLQEAMKGTAERANTLKEAVAGADAALARQQDFQAKYAPLVQSLAEATSAYEKMKDRKTEMDRALETGEISTEEYDKWNSKLEESKKTVRDLTKEVNTAKKEMGGPMIDQAQFDALQREYAESAREAENATKAFKEFNVTATEVSANADQVAQGAAKVADSTKGISAAAGAAAAGMVTMAVNAGLAADDLNTLSKQSGFSTEELQKWKYAADLVDVSVDTIVSAAARMKKNMGSSSSETQAAFDKLGISVQETSIQLKNAEVFFYEVVNGLNQVADEADRNAISMTLLGQSFSEVADKSAKEAAVAVEHLRDSMMSASPEVQDAFREIGVSANVVSTSISDSEKVFYQLLERLSMIPNETERDILAMQIFGKSADELAGIIDDGGKALRQLGQEAEDAGLILSQDALDGANAFNDGLDTLKAKAQATFMESGAALAENLLPALEKVVDAVGSLLEWFAGLDGGTLELLLSVLLAVAAIAPVAGAISAIAGAVSAVSGAVGMFTGAIAGLNVTTLVSLALFAKWVLIIGAIVTAVWLLVQAFNALKGETQDVQMPELPTVPDTSGGGRSSPSGYSGGGSSGYALRTATAQDLPHLAQGTVARANSPFMAVIGDNTQEPEVVSPLSTIRQAVEEANAASGGTSGATKVNVNFMGDLAQLARVLQPYITVETQRRGPQLVT